MHKVCWLESNVVLAGIVQVSPLHYLLHGNIDLKDTLPFPSWTEVTMHAKLCSGFVLWTNIQEGLGHSLQVIFYCSPSSSLKLQAKIYGTLRRVTGSIFKPRIVCIWSLLNIYHRVIFICRLCLYAAGDIFSIQKHICGHWILTYPFQSLENPDSFKITLVFSVNYT